MFLHVEQSGLRPAIQASIDVERSSAGPRYSEPSSLPIPPEGGEDFKIAANSFEGMRPARVTSISSVFPETKFCATKAMQRPWSVDRGAG